MNESMVFCLEESIYSRILCAELERAAVKVKRQRKGPLRRDPIPDHVRVFQAIAAKDSHKARQAMRELIVLGRMDTPVSRRPERRYTG